MSTQQLATWQIDIAGLFRSFRNGAVWEKDLSGANSTYDDMRLYPLEEAATRKVVTRNRNGRDIPLRCVCPWVEADSLFPPRSKLVVTAVSKSGDMHRSQTLLNFKRDRGSE